MREVDALLLAGNIATMDPFFTTLKNWAIAINDGRILDLGEEDLLLSSFKPKRLIKAKNAIAMPGLINTHTHAAMVLLRGLADDLPLKEWLEGHIWPAESKFVGPDFVKVGMNLALYEMVKSGTTLFCDMYFMPEETLPNIEEFKLRAVVGVPILDVPTPVSKSPKVSFERTLALIDLLKDSDLIDVAVSPHSPYTCSQGVLIEAAELAKAQKKPLQIHLSEEKWESEKIFSERKMSPVAYLDGLGLFQNRTIAAHVNWLFDGDIEILKERGVGVAHNPQSNMKLATGISPVPDLLKAGIKVGLGTDGAASNNDLDIFGEMDAAARLHKISRKDPTAVSAKEAARMATLGGAEVLGLQDEVGSLEAGKSADIILVDTDSPHMQPLYDIHSQLVYAAKGSDVMTVMVKGEVIYDKGELLTVDGERIIARAKEFAKRIKP